MKKIDEACVPVTFRDGELSPVWHQSENLSLHQGFEISRLSGDGIKAAKGLLICFWKSSTVHPKDVIVIRMFFSVFFFPISEIVFFWFRKDAPTQCISLYLPSLPPPLQENSARCGAGGLLGTNERGSLRSLGSLGLSGMGPEAIALHIVRTLADMSRASAPKETTAVVGCGWNSPKVSGGSHGLEVLNEFLNHCCILHDYIAWVF